MVKRAGSQTLAVDVYERLRAAILSGRYAAGERLRPSELCIEYGVSSSVIREALTRLTEQRLAVISPNRGFNVLHNRDDDVRELVEFRIINETAALRLSVARGDVEWESSVLAAHHRLKAASEDPGYGSEQWFVAHGAFHLALLSACGNSVLLETCRDVLAAGDLYLRWNRRSGDARPGAPLGGRNVAAEHAAIADAVLARDAERAAELYRAHLQLTADLMGQSRKARAAEAGPAS